MNLVFRIVFGIVVALIFVSITFSTFFIEKQYVTVPNLAADNSENLLSSGSLYYTHISKYESLYTSFEMNQNLDSESMTTRLEQEGKYMSSFRNIGSLHHFTGTGYTISQKGIGEIYIDTISKKEKIFVYARNTPVEITLTSDDGVEEYTTIYLAPGMYVEFRTGIGKNLNNADRLRISTVNKLGYISSLSNLEIDSALEIYFSQEESIIYPALEHIEQKEKSKTLYLNKLLSGDVPEISGNSYIQRYLHLFVNEEKKKVFYKNIVLKGYISLLQTKKIDTSLISQIKQDEEKLKNIDEPSYNTLLLLRSDIISALNSMRESGFIPAKIGFAKLETPNIDESQWLFPLYSFSLFSGNTQSDENTEQVTKNFFESFKSYMQKYENTQDPYDYFLYFLEQRLLFLLSGKIDEQSIGAMVEVLANYTILSFEAEYSEKNQKITQLYSISQILQSIDAFLRNSFFEPERDQNNLLLLSSNITLSGDTLNQLSGHVVSLYSIFEENNSLLNPISARDTEISENIIFVKKNIEEYLLAIQNYSQYVDEYDISKSTILNVNVFSRGQSEIDEVSGREYLQQFVGFSPNSYTLTVVNNTYYKVGNLIIGGRKFDFEIFPYSGSRLKNIYIDGELQTTQYTLDNIQADWEEKIETAIEEEKQQFDFSRFFILTFLTQEQRQVEDFEIQYTQQESKAEIVFKRDILLGERGEFAGLRNFLDIAYEDISLVQKGNSYDIYLDNIAYNVNPPSSQTSGSVGGVLNSQYVLNSAEHSFKNIRVRVESDKKGGNNTLIYEFGGVSINIVGNINIDSLEDTMTQMLSNLEKYLSVYQAIISNIQINNLIIEYNPVDKKTRFKFDSGEKSFTIILQNSEITGIYEGISKIASSPINLQNINSYLK